MIYNHYKGYSYKNTQNPKNDNLYCPLAVDTEFYKLDYKHPDYAVNPSPTITIQVSGIDSTQGIIYTHKDCEQIARHSTVTNDFIAIQYLQDKGFDINLSDNIFDHNKKYPKLIFHLYAHFICADLVRLFDRKLQEYLVDSVLQTNSKKGIRQERRVRTYTKYGKSSLPYLMMPYLVNYNDINYQLCIEAKDTIGLGGNISYNNLAQLTSVDLPYKNTLSKDELEKMNKTYLEQPELYDNYALGDLETIKIAVNFNQLYNDLLQVLDLPAKDCKMTIGSSVAQLLELALTKHVGNAENFKLLTEKANPKHLIETTKTSRLIMCKVDGGRCFNNRPNVARIEKPPVKNPIESIGKKSFIADIDIDGAYGTGLLHQQYPFGTPKSFNHPINNKREYITLRDFLKRHGDELKPNLWTMRVNTKQELTYSQDLIPSWVIPDKKIAKYFEENDVSIDTKEGYIKTFEREIKLGTITSDILEWIDNICSEKQKKELYDNLLVVNCYWYDKNLERNSIKQVLEDKENFEEIDKSNYLDESLINEERQCHSWCSVSIGELFLKELILKRKQYPKKTPENNFYKLIINTTYGVLVSRYFKVGNLVVGNNITAKCRCMAWYLEKGLNAIQTITDGCTFELDNINHQRKDRRLTANNLVRSNMKKTSETHIINKPLNIEQYNEIIINNEKSWIKYSDFLKILGKELVKEYGNDLNKYPRGFIGDEEQLIVPKIICEETLRKIYKNHNIEGFTERCKLDIEEDILNHVRNLFPNVSLLHNNYTNIKGELKKGYYQIEVRILSQKASFHGNADYCLLNNWKPATDENDNQIWIPTDDIYKMRGYKGTNCYYHLENDTNEITIEELELLTLEDDIRDDADKIDVDVPKEFLKGILDNPDGFKRFDIYIQDKIIKINDFKQNHDRYNLTNHKVGSTYQIPRLPSELVLGQFLYPTIKEFEKWQRNHYKKKDKYGQGLEGEYLNENGTLNYQLMIEDLPKKILARSTPPKKQPPAHPQFEVLQKLKSKIAKPAEE